LISEFRGKTVAVTRFIPPVARGAEVSLYEVLIRLQARGHHVTIITQSAPHDDLFPLVHMDSIDGENFEKVLVELKPDRVVTQMDWAEQTVRICNKLQVPVVFVSRVGDLVPNADGYIFNSSYHYERLRCLYDLGGLPCGVSLPVLRSEPFNSQEQWAPKFITIINPIRAKGGELVVALAKRFPEEIFLGVAGWTHPNEDGVTFEGPNIKLLERQNDMKSVYSRTKILLVPSLWEEPSPRVIPEAMVRGIPVMASSVGGISEVSHNAAVLLPPGDVDSWACTLKRLLADNERLAEIGVLGRSALEAWDDEPEINTFEEVLLTAQHIPLNMALEQISSSLDGWFDSVNFQPRFSVNGSSF